MPAAATVTQEVRYATPVIESPPQLPTKAEVARAIAAEAAAAGVACDIDKAYAFIKFIHKAVSKLRSWGYRAVYHVNAKDLRAFHGLMEVIMPDDFTVPPPGSAHDGLNRLETKGRELGILHTRDSRYIEAYCSVALILDAA